MDIQLNDTLVSCRHEREGIDLNPAVGYSPHPQPFSKRLTRPSPKGRGSFEVREKVV
ncbi:hypothetical protein sS8_3181 [Methylocaldum marinum]|uniref:Uncharacterized protein n=1 Tax=Methylocaldum marinum TaxID=1432792 RepID=A0A250KUC7_9GAMM|nr:hypothetical protein sS8_3181 [Methylocaldum marinum]